MSVTGIDGIIGGVARQQAGARKLQTPEDTFLSYVKKSPIERWVENWLKAHGLTKAEFDALPAERHEALAKEMAEDLKKAMLQKRV